MSQPASSLVSATDVQLRPLDTVAEYQACVDLQIEIWGTQFKDVAPASLLQVATHIGGIALGAFDADDLLVGFVFGLTGIRNDEVVHWSHMLGVRPAAREMGIGRRLKERQREELARRGIAHTFWTFDPLQARNAHLNLNRLGVEVEEYVVDMYGAMGSPLHHGLATDRLIVRCANLGRPPERLRLAPDAARSLPILTLGSSPDGEPATALVEIPADLHAIVARASDEAAAWRAAVRAHLTFALSHRYDIAGFHRDPVTGRSFYVIIKSS